MTEERLPLAELLQKVEAIKGTGAIAGYCRGAFDRNRSSRAVVEIIDAQYEGATVYVVGCFEITAPTPEVGKQTVSGNNLRLLETTDAGAWRTRIHIYNARE